MKNFYVLTKKLDICDVGFDGKAGVPEIMSLFQRALTFHTFELGVDFESVKKNHNAKWFISSAHIEIFKAPKIHDEVIVKTWPLSPSAVRFPRAFVLKDSGGQTIAAAYTEWCTVDCDSGKLLRSSVVTLPIDEYLEDVPVKREGKIEQKPTFPVYSKTVRVSDLDINAHVNNVSYIRFALDAFSTKELDTLDIKTFDIDYKTQTFEGDTVTIEKSEDNLCLVGKNGDSVIFTCNINKNPTRQAQL